MANGKFPRHVRALIDLRAGGHCEVMLEGICTQTVTDIHHRRPRGQGGSSDPDTATASNGLAVCRPCHDRLESRRQFAYSHGFLVRHPMPACTVPVWWRCAMNGRRRRYVFLTDAGGRETIPDM